MLVRDHDQLIRPRQQLLAGAGHPIDKAGDAQRVGQAVRVAELSRLLDRRLASGACLIGVAETVEVPLKINEQRDQGVGDVE